MKKSLLTAVCALVSCVGAKAQSVIGYNFTADTAPTSGTQTNFTAGMLSAGNQTASGGVVNTTSAAAAGAYTIPTEDGGGNNSGNGNLQNTVAAATAITATTSYDQVTFTPSTGYAVVITNFDFANRSTGAGPVSFSLRSSVDNYAADILTGSFTADSNYRFIDNAHFALSGAVNAAVTLRLYLYGGTSATAGNDRIDDLFVTVTATAVPEPGTFFTFLGGGMLLGWASRKKRRG